MKVSKKRLKRIVLEEYAKLHGLKLRRKAPATRSKKLKENKKYTRRELLEIKKLTARLKKLIK